MRDRRFALAGMIAPVLFVVVFTVEGWLRPGYHPMTMFVSELSLGPRGWVQITNFVLTGALIVIFGRGLAGWLRPGAPATASPLLLQVLGVSLMVSGPFRTDPSAMFNQVSVHGTIHGIFGAVVFSLAPVTCFVTYRRLRIDPALRALARWTMATGFLLVAGIVLLKISQVPGALFDDKGLIQRLILILFMVWLFALAALAWTWPSGPRPGSSVGSRPNLMPREPMSGPPPAA